MTPQLLPSLIATCYQSVVLPLFTAVSRCGVFGKDFSVLCECQREFHVKLIAPLDCSSVEEEKIWVEENTVVQNKQLIYSSCPTQ